MGRAYPYPAGLGRCAAQIRGDQPGGAGGARPIDPGVDIGHVHLKVADLDRSLAFYSGVLGFELTQRYGTEAAFVSAGGYHHHMAMNVWNSRGAGRRQPTLGLGVVEIEVPNDDDLGALGERLAHFGLETRDDGRTVEVDDPWANRIRVTVPGRG